MKKSLWKQISKIEADYKKYSLEELETLSKNDSNSMYALALRYCKNDDMKKGEECYEKSAKMGNVCAKYIVASKKLLSRNVQNEQNEGLLELEELANQNFVEAYLRLCSYYCNTPIFRDCDADETAYFHSQMFRIASKGYNIGIKECAYYLAIYYLYGYGTAENYEKYAELILPAARGGDANAMNCAMKNLYYGLCYKVFSKNINYSRTVIECDYEKAISYAKKLLKDSVYKSNAHYILGNCYFYGKGCEIDYKIAIANFKKCEDKNLNAKLQIAMCYANGLGVKKDETKAKDIFASVLNNFKINSLDREIPEQVDAWRNKASELGFEDANKISMDWIESYDAIHNKN